MTKHEHETFLLKRCDVLFIAIVLTWGISLAIGIVGVWQFSRLEPVTLTSLFGLTAKLSPFFGVSPLFKQGLKVLLAARDRFHADERAEELFSQVDSIKDPDKRDSTRAQLLILFAQESQLDPSSDSGRESKRLNAAGVESLGKSLLRLTR